MMLLTLPGTSVTYYGEEIGMMDVEVSPEQTQDYLAKSTGRVNSPIIVPVVHVLYATLQI